MGEWRASNVDVHVSRAQAKLELHSQSALAQSRRANRRDAQPNPNSSLINTNDFGPDASTHPPPSPLNSLLSRRHCPSDSGASVSQCRSVRAPAFSAPSALSSATRCFAAEQPPALRPNSRASRNYGIAQLGPRRCISGMSALIALQHVFATARSSSLTPDPHRELPHSQVVRVLTKSQGSRHEVVSRHHWCL